MSDRLEGRALVLVTEAAGVHTITLNHPERHNALTLSLLSDLRAAVAVAKGADAGCVVLQADGRSFSTGGDVAEFFAREGEELSGYAYELVGELNATILDLMDLPAPVIAAVHGPVTGGSLGLVLAADIAIGSHSAWFQPFYTEVGFSPDGGWSALLPHRVGYSRARAWQLNNLRVRAGEALESGLLSELHAHPRERAQELARDIVSRPRGAVVRTKALLGPGLAVVGAGLEREREEFMAQIVTDEARRGMAAFLGDRVGVKGER